MRIEVAANRRAAKIARPTALGGRSPSLPLRVPYRGALSFQIYSLLFGGAGYISLLFVHVTPEENSRMHFSPLFIAALVVLVVLLVVWFMIRRGKK